MKVRDLIANKSAAIHTTTPDAAISEAIKLLNQHNIGSLLVLEGEKLAGIITERDILHVAAEHGSKLDSRKVSEIMTRDLITCSPDDKLDTIMSLMTDNRIRHLPVLEAGKLNGIISIGDVVKAQLAKSTQEAEELKDYITGRR